MHSFVATETMDVEALALSLLGLGMCVFCVYVLVTKWSDLHDSKRWIIGICAAIFAAFPVVFAYLYFNRPRSKDKGKVEGK